MKQALVLIFVALATVVGISSVASQETVDLTDSNATVKEITVENDGLSFVQNEIRVNEGDRVRLTFVNTGGFHDWVIDEFDAATSQYSGGQSETIEFTADRAGTFEFYCSVGNHRARGMWGTFIVEG